MEQVNESKTWPRTEHLHERFRLGYLLTGDQEISVQAVIATLDSDDPGFIAKAIEPVAVELRTSAIRTRSRTADFEDEIGAWDPGESSCGAQLEQALLDIDIFPRCATLLTVFLQQSTESVALLLGVECALVKAGKAIGLVALARNLAGAY